MFEVLSEALQDMPFFYSTNVPRRPATPSSPSKEGTWGMGCFGQICATVTRNVLPECSRGMAVPTKFPVLHVGVCMGEFGRWYTVLCVQMLWICVRFSTREASRICL